MSKVFGGTDCHCASLGISEATYYIWCKKYGQMAMAEIRRLRQLEEKNRKLKQLVADLNKVILQEVLAKNPAAHAHPRAGADRHRSLSDRSAASVWATETESGVVVFPPSGRDDTAIRMRLRELAKPARDIGAEPVELV